MKISRYFFKLFCLSLSVKLLGFILLTSTKFSPISEYYSPLLYLSTFWDLILIEISESIWLVVLCIILFSASEIASKHLRKYVFLSLGLFLCVMSILGLESIEPTLAKWNRLPTLYLLDTHSDSTPSFNLIKEVKTEDWIKSDVLLNEVTRSFETPHQFNTNELFKHCNHIRRQLKSPHTNPAKLVYCRYQWPNFEGYLDAQYSNWKAIKLKLSEDPKGLEILIDSVRNYCQIVITHVSAPTISCDMSQAILKDFKDLSDKLSK